MQVFKQVKYNYEVMSVAVVVVGGRVCGVQGPSGSPCMCCREGEGRGEKGRSVCVGGGLSVVAVKLLWASHSEFACV